MKALVVDFETYYDDQYSLRNLTTQEYVYSDKFKIHGVGVAAIDILDDSPIEAHYFRASMLSSFEALLYELKKENNLIVVCHNAVFEGNILTKLGYIPDLIIDTAAMSRALLGSTLRSHSLDSVGEALFGIGKLPGLLATKGLRELPEDISQQLEIYCIRDVELTARIARKLYPHFPTKELIISDLVSRMAFDNPIQLDYEKVKEYYDRVIERKKTVFARAGIKDPSELRGREKFAEILTRFGVTPPTKISPATGKETYAFAKNDPEIKALLEHPNPDIQALVAAKLEASSTIEETRAARFLSLARSSWLGVPYRYSGAVQTHRLSGTDGLNMQNLPRGGGLRAALRAPRGHSLVVSDLSQIELRVTLGMAGDDEALQVLRRGDDLYCWFASKMYGREINEEDNPDERQIAKSAVLGCGFGMGASRFKEYAYAMGVKLSNTEADSIVASFRKTFWKIPKLWNNLEQIFTTQVRGAHPFIPVVFKQSDTWLDGGSYGFTLPCLLRVRYPNLARDSNGLYYETANGKERLFGGKIAENLAQSLARNILFDKAFDVATQVPHAKLSMSTHDELVYVVENSRLKESVDAIHRIMNSPVEWWPTLPLASKTKHGVYYGDIK